MVFSSIIFLAYFLPIFLLAYTAVPDNWKNAVILAFSIFFYAWGAPIFVFVLLASTIVDFYLVRSLYQATSLTGKKVRLALSLTLNLGLLAYFKYANFFVDNINYLLAEYGAAPMGWTEVLLPIGISFYTFQTLTYSVDVYRGILRPLDRLSDYLLFIMSFPQMIAGPIVRYQEVAGQIRDRQSTAADKILGFQRFCVGLAKKVFIANVLGAKADEVYALPLDSLDGPTAWLGAVAYAGQIYFDFAGYSDMAIGLGRMMGFRFPENFDSPYISGSISEFWRRWHITLGRWMRDYLYIPLGGNRVGSKARLYFNLWVVFLLSGLWHGASWNFVIWGAFHGLFLVLDRLFLLRWLKAIGRPLAVSFTCFIVIIGWVFFRQPTFAAATSFIEVLFTGPWPAWPVATTKFWATLIVSLVASWAMLLPFGERLHAWLYPKELTKVSVAASWILVSLGVYALSLAIITSEGFNPFIYFRF